MAAITGAKYGVYLSIPLCGIIINELVKVYGDKMNTFYSLMWDYSSIFESCIIVGGKSFYSLMWDYGIMLSRLQNHT